MSERSRVLLGTRSAKESIEAPSENRAQVILAAEWHVHPIICLQLGLPVWTRRIPLAVEAPRRFRASRNRSRTLGSAFSSESMNRLNAWRMISEAAAP